MEAYSHSSRQTNAGRRGRRARQRHSAFLSWRRQGLLFALALALALATIALLLLGDAMGVLPGGSPFGAPAARGATGLQSGATPTPTVSSTPSGPGTLSLDSPGSAKGPAGATLTFSGSGWGTDNVVIGASLSGCAPVASWANNVITNVSPTNGAFTNVSAQWPSALTNAGAYTLCAYESSGQPTTGPSYTLLTATAPSLTLSAATDQVSQEITITGANFLGVSGVQLTAQGPNSSPQAIGAVTPDGSGGFTTNYAPAIADIGTVTITASSVPEGSAPPVLTANTTLTVTAANTPTPTVDPTATASSATTVPPANTAGPSLGLIIGLIVGILLALLLIIGVVAFIILRRRSATPDGGDSDPYYGGRDPTGRFPSRGGFSPDGYGRGYSDEYPGAYGQASGYSSAGGRAMRGSGAPYGGPGEYANPRDPYSASGGVAAWDDPPPDPNWRARPMTGRRAPQPDDSLDGLSYPDLPPVGAPGDSYDGYPTLGRWDETTGAYTNETGAYGDPGFTNETGAYGDPGFTDETGAYGGSGAARYGEGRPNPGAPYADGGYGPAGPPAGRRPTPGRAGGYPDVGGASTRPVGPPAGASSYPPAPLVPPGSSAPGGPRSSPGRGGPTGRPPQPDPRRGAPDGWDDPDASDDGRGGW